MVRAALLLSLLGVSHVFVARGTTLPRASDGAEGAPSALSHLALRPSGPGVRPKVSKAPGLAALAQILSPATPLGDCGPSCYRNAKVWGPPTWFFLHSLSLSQEQNISQTMQDSIKTLMYTLQTALPCPACGKHLKEHMLEDPIEPHLGSRDALVTWMVNLHNKVNRDRGVREWGVDEVVVAYQRAFDKGNAEKYMSVLGPTVHGHALRGAGGGSMAWQLLALVLSYAMWSP